MTRVIDRALAALAWIGGAAVLLLTLHVGLRVIAREGFGGEIPMTYEIVTKYYMLGIAFLAIGWVERQDGMVSVELIDNVLGPRQKVWLGRFVALFSFVIYAGLAYVTWLAALKHYATGSYVLVLDIYLPLWPGHFVLPFGFAIAALAVGARLFAPARETAA